MTFAIALANADQVIQVSDRRLTAPDGRLIDDSANKVGHAICDDASFLYCFTGVARVGHHITSQWILEGLARAAKRNRCYSELIYLFAEEATTVFAKAKDFRLVPASSKRLTVMFSGYTANGFLVNALISNFQNFETFTDSAEAAQEFSVYNLRSTEPASANPTLIQRIGQYTAMREEDERALRELLVQRRSAETIRQAAIQLIRRVSDRPSSGGTVGKKINTARLDYRSPFMPVAGYDTDEVESSFPLVDGVNLRTGANELMMMDAKISTQEPSVFPTRVHRNALCPCGSGKRFRYCHR